MCQVLLNRVKSCRYSKGMQDLCCLEGIFQRIIMLYIERTDRVGRGMNIWTKFHLGGFRPHFSQKNLGFFLHKFDLWQVLRFGLRIRPSGLPYAVPGATGEQLRSDLSMAMCNWTYAPVVEGVPDSESNTRTDRNRSNIEPDMSEPCQLDRGRRTANFRHRIWVHKNSKFDEPRIIPKKIFLKNYEISNFFRARFAPKTTTTAYKPHDTLANERLKLASVSPIYTRSR